MLPEGEVDCVAALELSDPFAGAEPMLFVFACGAAKTDETPAASASNKKVTDAHPPNRRDT